mgnify:CR=1 FL=1
MNKFLIYLLGIITGIGLTFGFAYLKSETDETIKDNGMTFFENPGEKFSINAFEVIQVIDDNHALAIEAKWESFLEEYMPGELTVLITNDSGEYYYDDQFVEYYYPDCEPWEQNVTTLYAFESKWESQLPRTVVIPTPEPDPDAFAQRSFKKSFRKSSDQNSVKDIQNAAMNDARAEAARRAAALAEMIWDESGNGKSDFVGVYEGAGYQSKGVYRPYPDCRMKTNSPKAFCPVCQSAIADLIDFYLGRN